MNHLPLAVIIPFLLCGCGGVLDSTVTHELNMKVGRSGQTASVSIRSYKDIPFGRPQSVVVDDSNRLHATFKEGWGRAFFIIPPIGSFPSRPPKPAYAVIIDRKQIVVSPDTPSTTYRWESQGWHTDADAVLPR